MVAERGGDKEREREREGGVEGDRAREMVTERGGDKERERKG